MASRTTRCLVREESFDKEFIPACHILRTAGSWFLVYSYRIYEHKGLPSSWSMECALTIACMYILAQFRTRFEGRQTRGYYHRVQKKPPFSSYLQATVLHGKLTEVCQREQGPELCDDVTVGRWMTEIFWNNTRLTRVRPSIDWLGRATGLAHKY